VSPDGPVSVAWKWYISLSERGKDVTQFRMVFIYLVVKAVKCGRRFCGQEKAHDVLSSQAQRRHGFTVESLPISTRTSFEDLYAAPHGQRHLDAFEERLQDNTQTPVPDQVQWLHRRELADFDQDVLRGPLSARGRGCSSSGW
jgi:hypothetical protein